MKKQFMVLGAVILVAVSAGVFLAATPADNQKNASPKCTKTCESKPVTTPQTGFFIFDSFSGNL